MLPRRLVNASKFGVVTTGFAGAFAIASAAVAVRVASTTGPVAQASSGMYVFGDLMLFVAVLGTVGLVPAAAALVFLRPYRRFWTVLSIASFGVAITGLAAIALFAVGRHQSATALAEWAAFSVLRILVAPLRALTFTVCTAISPQGPACDAVDRRNDRSGGQRVRRVCLVLAARDGPPPMMANAPQTKP